MKSIPKMQAAQRLGLPNAKTRGEINREERRRRIVDTATKQFRKRGFDKVKIEDIAEMAHVSVGTIYNYFKNKGDVLVAITDLEVSEVLALGEEIVSNPPDDALKAIDSLILTYIDHSLTYLNKEMWRQAMAISIIQPESPSGAAYIDLDAALRDQTVRLFEALVRRKLLRSDTDAFVIGCMVWHTANDLFVSFVKQDKQKLAELKSMLRRKHKAIVKLIAA
jgi:AcrR family transcriptional regulator